MTGKKNNLLQSFFTHPVYYDIKKTDIRSFNDNNNSSSNILVLCKSQDFGEKQQKLLENILSSIHQSRDSVRLVRVVDTTSFSIQLLKKDFVDIRSILCFGIQPEDLGMRPHLKPYRSYQFERFSLVFADDLTILAHSPQKKKMLWQSLKSHFLKN